MRGWEVNNQRGIRMKQVKSLCVYLFALDIVAFFFFLKKKSIWINLSFDHIVLVSQVTLFCSFSKNILCIWKLRNKNRQWLHRRNSQYSCSCICHHKYSFTTSKFGFLDFCTGFHKRVWKCFLHTNKRKISVPVFG